MNIKLIDQPLFVAELHPGLSTKAGNHTGNRAAQTVIFLVRIAQGIGCAEHHKHQRQKGLFISVGDLRHATLPVTHNLLRHQVFIARLGPVALNH